MRSEIIDGKWRIVEQQVAAPEDPRIEMAVTTNLQVRGDMVWPLPTTAQAVTETEAPREIRTWTDVSLRVVEIGAILPHYGPSGNALAMYGLTIPDNVRGKAEMHIYYAPLMNDFTSLDINNSVRKVNAFAFRDHRRLPM